LFLASGEKSAITQAVEHTSANEVLWKQGSHTDSKLEVFSYRKPHFSPTLLLTKFCNCSWSHLGSYVFKGSGGLTDKGYWCILEKVGVNESRMYRIGCHIYSSFLTQLRIAFDVSGSLTTAVQGWLKSVLDNMMA
jgi:hypothetical protein